MATRRQPLIPGWLIPGVSAATLVVAVALAAFLALWWNAPQGSWAAIWQDSYLWHVVRFSFWQAFLSALLSVVPAIFLARALYRRRFPGRLALLRLCAMTLILPVLVAVFGILSVYGRQGWLATLCQSLGLEWTFSPYGLQGILLAHVFFNLPMASRLLLQALENIPGEQRQLAAQLGMRGWHFFRFVEWPWLRRQIPPVAALIFMLCFASFATVLSLGGGPQATTIELAIYQALSYDYDPARAAMLALIQMVCCLGLVLLSQRLSKAIAPGTTLLQGWRDPDDRLHSRICDTVLIVLALLLLLTAIAAALPFISYAPNRLVSGEGRHLWQLWPQTIWMLVGVGCAWLTACFIPGKKGSICALILAQFVFVLLVWGAGKAATQLAQNGSALARTSLGSGFWLAAALALLACSDAIRRISTHPLWRWLLHMQIAIIPLWLLYSGTLNDLSLMKEYANRQDVFDDALAQHLTLLFGAVLPALVIGVPLGIWCYFSTARQGAIFSLLNVIQTVPSVALFGLLIAPLAALVTAFPWLGKLGIAGTGMTPALIALVLYALLPLVRGVVVGLNQIPRDVLESARAMGMSGARRFLHVQLPLALPVFLRSLRVVMVQTVSMAVIAALIGAGGFGALVFQGLLSSAIDLVLLGVIPVIVLAVLTDALFDLLIALLKVKRND